MPQLLEVVGRRIGMVGKQIAGGRRSVGLEDGQIQLVGPPILNRLGGSWRGIAGAAERTLAALGAHGCDGIF